ncbi:unnamed protein product [Linum trigynum]|uniref:Gnk2-homologous domain-containing protein n=1 Tax=Linum trigynum TaxID=586398 RepID=A0AAV2DTI5_9ROSI
MMMRGAAVMVIMVSLSSAMFFFLASGYEFYALCNKAKFPDTNPLESAAEAALANLVNGEVAGLHRCADGTSDIYTMHGEASCGSSDGCDDCLNAAKSYLLLICSGHLGGQAHDNSGYCSIRFENYIFCT